MASNANTMLMAKEHTMIPSKYDIFERELSEGLGNPGKPVVIENVKKLGAYTSS